MEVYSDNVIETTMNSSPVLYSEVTEIENNNGYTKYYFTDLKTHPDSQIFKEVDNDVEPGMTFSPANIGNINLPYRSNNYKRSKLYKQEFHDQNFVKIKSSTTEFEDVAEVRPSNYVTQVTDRFRTKYFFKQLGGQFSPKKIESEDILNASSIKTTTEISYKAGYNCNPIRKKVIDPSGDVFETRYQYLDDIIHGPPHNPGNFVPPYGFIFNLYSKNISGVPLVISNYKNNIFLNRTQTLYEFNIANDMYTILPKKTLYYSEEKNIPQYSTINLPDTNYGSVEMTYDKYDSKGNLQQYTTQDGISTVIIWGYNQTQPIAKIEAAKLTDIQQSLIDSIINASNTDAAAELNNNETELLNILNTFRNSLPNYQITTYTYDPLIGVRSITPPSGIREAYFYDSANRLTEIRENDQTGNLLKEFKYNYKQ